MLIRERIWRTTGGIYENLIVQRVQYQKLSLSQPSGRRAPESKPVVLVRLLMITEPLPTTFKTLIGRTGELTHILEFIVAGQTILINMARFLLTLIVILDKLKDKKCLR